MSLEGYNSDFIKRLHFSQGKECNYYAVNWQWPNVIRLPEIKTAELSTYGNFAKCHLATSVFRVWPGNEATYMTKTTNN